MFKNCCKVLDFVQNVLQTMFNNFAQENVSNFSNCLICFSYFDQAFVFPISTFAQCETLVMYLFTLRSDNNFQTS